MKTIRFGMIGTGSIAQRFVSGLAHVPQAEALAVFNRTTSKAKLFAAANQIPQVYATLDELLASDIDAVYIATPHPSHAALSIAALKAGKAVLCEKPAAVTLAELDEVIATAQAAQRLYMEAMKPAFFPLYQQIRERITAGAIGDVKFIRAGFANPNVPADHAVLDPAQAGGGLLDIGIYAAFLAVDWLGTASEVQSLGRIGATGVDTFASWQSQHQHGISQLYCGLDVAGSGEALISGTQGYVLLHDKWWNPARATLVTATGEHEALAMPPVGSGLNYETAHFCELLRSGQQESPILLHAKTRAALQMTLQAHDEIADARIIS
ncbi:Gfo/Idh/MocA family protein [Deefgea sp. CFH1-16]|uniref:Gfo/Idh/MocA family protein n=1 Tax=Deefgea sp. CFH1-16 TaxID=2675457 RepID=UPI0015F6D73C|nr:Gfo/Idh/MocA family oxidoreductase [Deefgea sp. CFH1-16]MBM5574545.1 gfo/Idh/MocA family oxidoreductase [Deefgea sp. CFH1-16]